MKYLKSINEMESANKYDWDIVKVQVQQLKLINSKLPNNKVGQLIQDYNKIALENFVALLKPKQTNLDKYTTDKLEALEQDILELLFKEYSKDDIQKLKSNVFPQGTLKYSMGMMIKQKDPKQKLKVWQMFHPKQK